MGKGTGLVQRKVRAAGDGSMELAPGPIMNPRLEQLARLKAYYETKLFGEAEFHAVREQVRQGQGTLVLLDARSRKAFLAGHIPGALSVPLDRAADVARMLAAEREYVTYSWGHA